MTVAQGARRDRWSRYVKRALENAKTQRGWTITKVLEESDIARSTLYSWINASWKDDVLAGNVEKFCDALGQPTEDAFHILWPGKFGRRVATEPVAMDPDLELLLRKLVADDTPEMEKYFIRESLRQLANRIAPTSQPRKRRA
jgi:transcriptional regulator with XRE-family HTH domain